MKAEPKPGQWLHPEEFAEVVRLTPLVAIDLILRNLEDCVLVGRRTNEPAKGMWFVPGGRISKNERKSDAFRRISRDELGVELTLEEGRLLGAYEHFYPTNRMDRPGFGTHYITIAYEVLRHIPIEQLPRDQHAEYRWMTVSELLATPTVHANTKAYFR